MVDYTKLKQTLSRVINTSVENLRATFQAEFVRLHWDVGRVLRETQVISDHPHQSNAAHIARLAKDFKRPEQFFYDCAKFHRLYPKAAPKRLTWSHYELLLRVGDPKKRREFERRAILDQISSSNFRMLTRCPAPEKALPKPAKALIIERGRLYHYRAISAPACARKPGWTMIDLGFSIQRAVRYSAPRPPGSGLIVYSVKEDHDYKIRITAPTLKWLYTYQAMVERVIDGDTMIVHINMGFDCWCVEKLRFRGIDAPEKTTALGQKARQFVKDRLNSSPCLIVRTFKQEKYGRFLADIFYKKGCDNPDEVAAQGVFLNQELIDEGLAVAYEG